MRLVRGARVRGGACEPAARGQTPDAEIAACAVAEGFILVTKDDDFAMRHPPGDYRLVWLRCGNITNRALREWLKERWTAIAEGLEFGEALIEVR